MERAQVYKCSDCGAVMEVVHPGSGEAVCCGAVVERLPEKREDTGLEKHVPVIEAAGDDVRVKVGSVPHPMEEEHYIAWIEITAADGEVRRRYLSPGDNPEAVFAAAGGGAAAREYCTVHGLWKS